MRNLKSLVNRLAPRMRTRSLPGASRANKSQASMRRRQRAGRIGVLALCLSLIAACLLFKTTYFADAQSSSGVPPMTGTQARLTSSTVVNFNQLAQQEKQQKAESNAPAQHKAIDEPVLVPEEPADGTDADADAPVVDDPIYMDDAPVSTAPTAGPAIASPSAESSFEAEEDNNAVIPPDTDGAVGLTKVMATHNSNYVIEDKATGEVLSSVSIDGFWAATGEFGAFDPKTLYDPYNNRWILVAVTTPRSPASSLLIGISQTSDPSGDYSLFRSDADASDATWADFPSIGFNKNWITISTNMISMSTGQAVSGRLLMIDYPTLRTGTFSAQAVNGISSANGGLSMQPAVTYSETEETEYLITHLSSGGGTYKFSTITGTPASPLFTVGLTKTNPLGGWRQPGGNILPQAPGPNGTAPRMDCLDARITKSIFRNGGLYYTQTIAFPTSTALPIDRTAAQWVQVNTAGDFVQGGRIEDQTATATNGGKWYAFPSLSVNKNNDVLVGYTQFASNQYPSAGYSFRAAEDLTSTMRLPVVFKVGEGYYEKTFGTGKNRWGDYSNTQVDPANDRDLWTIQEYAALPVGSGDGSGRWGTWWGKVRDNDQIAFITRRDGNNEVYTMDIHGNNQTNISNNVADEYGPAWSPDGKKLAYSSFRSNSGDVYVTNADGSNPINLTPYPGSDVDAAWSPDGTKIVFSSGRDGNFEIYLMNADGTNQVRLTTDAAYDRWPSWGGDGSKIVFLSTRDGNEQIYSMNIDGTNQTRLTNNTFEDMHPQMSPDGRRVAFTSNRSGNYEIYVMNLDGTNQVRITTTTSNNYYPTWSSDGTRIAFTSDRDGNFEVYVMNSDGNNQTRLTTNAASDYEAAYQPR